MEYYQGEIMECSYRVNIIIAANNRSDCSSLLALDNHYFEYTFDKRFKLISEEYAKSLGVSSRGLWYQEEDKYRKRSSLKEIYCAACGKPIAYVHKRHLYYPIKDVLQTIYCSSCRQKGED